MQIFDGPNTTVAVPHGEGSANRLYLADVYIGKKAHYTFIMLANNSRDARARLKKNARAVINKIRETHWKSCYRNVENRTQKMREVLTAIKNNKIKLTELAADRVYPVSYFDDTRSIS